MIQKWSPVKDSRGGGENVKARLVSEVPVSVHVSELLATFPSSFTAEQPVCFGLNPNSARTAIYLLKF